jgi:hypothetical protein
VQFYWGGKPFVRKFGKYLLLNEHHLDAAHKFFSSKGAVTVLICRFIPVLRHLISGLTILGAGLWNGFLAWVGTVLQSRKAADPAGAAA